jgi:ATP-dependent Clp protease ATP-binding subunit ClpC
MTSNIGVRDLKDFGAGIGFSTRSKDTGQDDLMKSTIQNALRKTFSPEFLNRLDDVIIFNSLRKEHIHQIIDITLNSLFERIHSLGYKVDLTEKAKDFLADKGYDPQYGARPLNRAIQKYLEDQVAEEILKGDVKEGEVIVADHKDPDDHLTISSKKTRKKEESKKNDQPENKKGNTEEETKQEKN